MDYPVLTISASNNQRATVSQRRFFLKEAQLHHHHSSECVCVHVHSILTWFIVMEYRAV